VVCDVIKSIMLEAELKQIFSEIRLWRRAKLFAKKIISNVTTLN